MPLSSIDHLRGEIETLQQKLPPLPREVDKRKALFQTKSYQEEVETSVETLLPKIVEHPCFSEALTALKGIENPEKSGTFLSVLPENKYHYHNYYHSYNVLKDSLYLAFAEQISSQSIINLAISAVFHDIGYIEDPDYYARLPDNIRPDFKLLELIPGRFYHNETIGAKTAVAMMRNYNRTSDTIHFQDQDIRLVQEAIMATELQEAILPCFRHEMESEAKFPVQIAPQNHPFANYLLDGDLGNVWKREIIVASEAVFLEVQAINNVLEQYRYNGDVTIDITAHNLQGEVRTDFEKYISYLESRSNFAAFSLRLLLAKKLLSDFAHTVYENKHLYNEMAQRQQLLFLKTLLQTCRQTEKMLENHTSDYPENVLPELVKELYDLSNHIEQCDLPCTRQRLERVRQLQRKTIK